MKTPPVDSVFRIVRVCVVVTKAMHVEYSPHECALLPCALELCGCQSRHVNPLIFSTSSNDHSVMFLLFFPLLDNS